jgi:hypothetical protein
MSEETNKFSRRTVLKTTSAATVATTGFLASADRGRADDCNTCEEYAPSPPEDTDFDIRLHASPTADQIDKLSDYADYVENEFNYHVSDFSVSVQVYDDGLTKSEIENYSSEDEPFFNFAAYIEETQYGGDWSGEQGDIDFYMYDESAWSDTVGNGGMYTSSAYNGASPDSGLNPHPVGVASGSSDGDAGCRIKHELTHGFLYQCTDEYGYHQDDHKLMNVSNGGNCSEGADCRELGSLAGTFIDYAYTYNRVYFGTDDCVYKCTGDSTVG